MFLCSNSRHLHTFQRFVVSSLCYFTLSRSLASKKQSPTQFPRSVCFINHALPLKNNSKTISFLLDQKPYFCSNSSIWPSFCRFFSTEQTSIPVLQEVPEKYLCVASILDQFAQLSREQKELQNKRKFIKPIEILEKYPDWDPLSEEVPVIKTEREVQIEGELNLLSSWLPFLIRELVTEDVTTASSLFVNFIKKSNYHPILPTLLRQIVTAEELLPLFIAMAQHPDWRLANLKDFMRILITHTRGISFHLGWNVERIVDLVSHLPKASISSQLHDQIATTNLPPHLLWQPEEIGEFLGRIVADEMELDYLVNILGQLATKAWDKEATLCRWQDYMGYMATIISSALAVNKHWEDEDFVNVLVDVTNDIGKWALRKWDDFRSEQYREFLVDLISLIAIKWGRYRHDVRLIVYLTRHLCERWPPEFGDELGKRIAQRMFEERRTAYSRLYHFIQEKILQKSPKKNENQPPLLSYKELARLDRTDYSARSKLWKPPMK